MEEPRQHCKISPGRVFLFFKIYETFCKLTKQIMHKSILDESPNYMINAFYGAKMRNFGEISMSCLSSIHFFTLFGNFYPKHKKIKKKFEKSRKNPIFFGNFSKNGRILDLRGSGLPDHRFSFVKKLFFLISIYTLWTDSLCKPEDPAVS
jgi:hypothetical protein